MFVEIAGVLYAPRWDAACRTTYLYKASHAAGMPTFGVFVEVSRRVLGHAKGQMRN
jgi:hypothetical protein